MPQDTGPSRAGYIRLWALAAMCLPSQQVPFHGSRGEGLTVCQP